MTNVLLFLATVVFWGTTWIGMKLQVGPVPPVVSVFYRIALAGLIMLAALAALRRLRLPARVDQPFILAQALCLFCFNFICFYNAAGYLPSGLASVIFSLSTVFNAINARIFFGERVAARTLIAGAIGVAGVALLFGRDLLVDLDERALKGVAFAMAGTMFFSLGNMASRRNSLAGVRTEVANGWGMVYGALVLFVVALATGAPFVAPPDATYTAALLYLTVFGSVVAFMTYLLMVARMGSAKAAYSTVFFPIVALAISTVYEGYQWTPLSIAGLALTLLGNVVMFAPARMIRRRA